MSVECRGLQPDNLTLDGPRRMFVEKNGPRITRKVPLDSFSPDVLRAYHEASTKLPRPTKWLCVATSVGKQMKDDLLRQRVRASLKSLNFWRRT